VLVDLLAEIDSPSEADEFYDRACQALCRLTSIERSGLFLYDTTLRTVRAVGCHGIDSTLLEGVEGTLQETPIAQRALAEDRVVEASEELEGEVPPRYARFAGITTIVCTPVSAGGRWLGVIFADRGGGQFTLTPEERQTIWTIGKLAALAATVEGATTQREAARRLSERISLIREIHERVIQRLFGLLLVAGSEHHLSPEQRGIIHDELRDVLGELRSALGGSLAPLERRRHGSTRRMLERIVASRDEVSALWAEDLDVPRELEPVAQSVLLEALRNVEKHAEPTSVAVTVEMRDGAFVLEIVNDGVRDGVAAEGTGLGLRMATIEALQHNGIVEFGPLVPNRWRVRLVVPQGEQ